MEPTSVSLLMLMGLSVFVEYGVKQWAESIPRSSGRFTRNQYLLYRLFHTVLLVLLTTLLFDPWPHALTISVAVILIGCLEVPIYRTIAIVRSYAPIRCRWLHTGTMIAIAFVPILLSHTTPVSLRAWFTDGVDILASYFRVEPTSLVLIVVGYLVLAQPTNYLIRWFIDKETDRTLPEMLPVVDRLSGSAQYQTASTTDLPQSLNAEEFRAGRTIGKLERWLIVTLLLLSQYGLIGLVLTAKSVVRFRKFEQVPTFAEYYLLGTLYSMIFAIGIGLLLQSLIA